jgi:hypothetical protein
MKPEQKKDCECLESINKEIKDNFQIFRDTIEINLERFFRGAREP